MWIGNEAANMNEIRFSFYAAHDHDPYVLTYADLQSMCLLCESLYMAGLAQKHERTLPHTSNKGLVPKP
jgi:hypothetical protein